MSFYSCPTLKTELWNKPPMFWGYEWSGGEGTANKKKQV